ncbi:hypothetical protein [Pseudomonas monteilii]|uniref:hypothetical protein n=1 Tax=Pseudomonas monteilii TaxID=76759 RepID=UPI003D98E68B
MRISSAVAGLVLLSSPLLAHAGKLSDATDRFTGLRSVSWSTVPSEPEAFTFNTYAYVPEKNVAWYVVELITWADTAKYRNCNFVNWLIDGRRATELNAVYEPSYAGSATVERFTIKGSRKAIETFATAKTVEYSVCGNEGVVSPEDLEGLRQVIAASE